MGASRRGADPALTAHRAADGEAGAQQHQVLDDELAHVGEHQGAAAERQIRRHHQREESAAELHQQQQQRQAQRHPEEQADPIAISQTPSSGTNHLGENQ